MNTNKTQTNKFALTFATVFAVHIAIIGIFVGSVAYGETGNIKINGRASDKHYVGVDEQIPPPRVEEATQTEQPAQTAQTAQTAQPQQKDQHIQTQTQSTNNVATPPSNIATPSSSNALEKPKNTINKNIPSLSENKQQLPIKTKTYTVKSGDTLYSIAKKYKLSIKRLIEINKIKDTNKIAVGQILKFM